MVDYSNMTQEDFDRFLVQIMKDESAESLLQVPGAYEVFSEHFNNAVLDAWAETYNE